jgi:hypothetical protein
MDILGLKIIIFISTIITLSISQECLNGLECNDYSCWYPYCYDMSTHTFYGCYYLDDDDIVIPIGGVTELECISQNYSWNGLEEQLCLENNYLWINIENIAYLWMFDPTWNNCIDPSTLNLELNEPSFFSINTSPNPFNPITNIYYTVPILNDYKISIYNINGSLINTIFEGKRSKNIKYSINWSPFNIPSGLYIVQISSEKHFITQKISYIK